MGKQQRERLPIAQVNVQSPVTEAYRAIRTNIQFAGISDPTKVILVTSTVPHEGKTCTTVNLGVVSAQAGNRVLLIDGDLRKPQLHHRLQVSNLDGLSNTLIRDTDPRLHIQETLTANLFVLTSGSIPPNPSEILSSRAFRRLVESYREEFDYIFIDSPPVLTFTDALVLTAVSDGTVFVIDTKKTNRNLARKAILSLEQVHARILGLVLNRLPKNTAEGYYARKYYTQTQPVNAQ